MEQGNERQRDHAAGHPASHEAVGRVRVAPEEGDAPGPADAAAPGPADVRSREWSFPAILLGVLALLLMVAALVVILSGAFAYDGGGGTSRLTPILLLVWRTV